jgi:glycogen operon protein
LRFWVQEMHVDGFRFDLTTTVAREAHGFDGSSGFLDAVIQDPVLSKVKLVAEPWDIGYGGYQLGNFPPGWAEWNDRFRDTVRRFWRGDANVIGDLAGRLTGSANQFNRRGRRPWASVNFITAHDGFTLQDLVSYNRKHNDANGEGNRDGTDNNISWNCGVEGLTNDPAINQLRQQQKRNLMATLLLSLGTPMIVAGDEFGRSQQGNNNAYCQDNEISWVDWQARTPADMAFTEYVGRLLRLRRETRVFRRKRFLTGKPQGELGLKDVAWLAPEGHEMKDGDWSLPHARCLGMQLFDAGEAADEDHQLPELFLMLLNGHDGPLSFILPAPSLHGRWHVQFDTARADAEHSNVTYAAGERFPLLARSCVLLRDC